MKSSLITFVFAIAVTIVYADDPPAESKIEIRLVGIAAEDPAKTPERIFVIGSRGYRNLEEITNIIKVFSSKPETHFAVYGTCFPNDPQFTAKEIEHLEQACKEAGVVFTHYLGG